MMQRNLSPFPRLLKWLMDTLSKHQTLGRRIRMDSRISETSRLFKPTELLNTKKFWESRGIRKGMLPNIVKTDPHSGNEIECYMTMNGIPIDPNAEAVASKL